MFQLPKIKDTVKTLYNQVKTGGSLVSNVFDGSFSHFTTIQQTAITLATTLQTNESTSWNQSTKTKLLQCLNKGVAPVQKDGGNLIPAVTGNNSEAKEIPFGSGKYWIPVEQGTGTYAMPQGYDYSIVSVVDVWAKNMLQSNKTTSELIGNISNWRYGTILKSSLATKVIESDCASFVKDSMATISEDLLKESVDLNDSMIQFCFAAQPLIGVTDIDTPEEFRQLDNVGYWAETIISQTDHFGTQVNDMQDLQDSSQTELNLIIQRFSQVAGLTSLLDDPCVSSAVELFGSDITKKATGVLDRTTKLVDDSNWKQFNSMFGL